MCDEFVGRKNKSEGRAWRRKVHSNDYAYIPMAKVFFEALARNTPLYPTWSHPVQRGRRISFPSLGELYKISATKPSARTSIRTSLKTQPIHSNSQCSPRWVLDLGSSIRHRARRISRELLLARRSQFGILVRLKKLLHIALFFVADRNPRLCSGSEQRRLLGVPCTVHPDTDRSDIHVGQHTPQLREPGADRHSVEDDLHAVLHLQQIWYPCDEPWHLRTRYSPCVRRTRRTTRIRRTRRTTRIRSARCSFGCVPPEPAPRRRLLPGRCCVPHGLQQPHWRLLLLVIRFSKRTSAAPAAISRYHAVFVLQLYGYLLNNGIP